MTGLVSPTLELLLPLTVFGPAKRQFVMAVIDTGFTDELSLPAGVCADLGLARIRRGASTLADGRREEYDIFAARILWFDALREVEVLAVGREALAGARLLAGYRLRADFRPDGVVRVRPLA